MQEHSFEKDSKRFEIALEPRRKVLPLWQELDENLSVTSSFDSFQMTAPTFNRYSFSQNITCQNGIILKYLDDTAAAFASFLYPVSNGGVSFQRFDGAYDAELEELGRITTRVFSDPSSNFWSNLAASVRDAVQYGECCFAVHTDDYQNTTFQTIPIREVVTEYGSKGEVTAIFRSSTQRFGSNLKEVLEVYEKVGEFSTLAELDFSSPPILYRKYVDKALVEQSNLLFWPIATGVLQKDNNSGVPNGLGTSMLINLKQFNAAQKLQNQAIELQVKPPLYHNIAMDSNLDISLNPGVIMRGSSMALPFTLVQTSIDMQALSSKIERDLQAIRALSMVDITTLPEGDMTAEEVRYRIGQKITLLFPYVSSLQQMLDVIVKRVALSILRSEENARGIDFSDSITSLKVFYKTRFTEMRDLTAAAGVANFAQSLGMLAQLDPKVLARVDMDALVKEYATLSNVGNVLRADDEYDQLIQAIQQQQVTQ